jgi:hypothetical protein
MEACGAEGPVEACNGGDGATADWTGARSKDDSARDSARPDMVRNHAGGTGTESTLSSVHSRSAWLSMLLLFATFTPSTVAHFSWI